MKEKDFTLAVCLRIQKRLHELLPEADIRLTRNNDTYLALVERAEVANSLNADIFLSIHGNAYADARAGGVETFYLSAAKSRGAMRVAARENGISLARMTDLQATLVDLVVTGKKTESALLAHEVHNSLISTLKQRHHAARDRGVKTAPFYVLPGRQNAGHTYRVRIPDEHQRQEKPIG
jgi:N-acetylmuramoyl-L-alanine amidase